MNRLLITLSIVLCFVAPWIGATRGGALENHVPNTVENRYLQLLSRVENLEKRDKEQQADITMLRSELYTEKQRTSRLEAKISLLELTVGKRRNDDMKTTDGDDVQQKQDNSPINTENKVRNTPSDKTSGTTSEKTSRIRRHQGMPVIAFHATLTNDMPHTGAHQGIPFDNVITNIGVAYNPHFGSFIAPVPGVYVFFTTMMGELHHVLHCSIVKNGNSVANLYIRGVESSWANDSAMVVLHLNKGDDVGIQNNDSDKTINGDHYSMFSGFLLYEDHPSESLVGK